MACITAVFLRWMGMRAVLHRGYWLVTSLYVVLDAHLLAFQLVFLGTAQGIIALVCAPGYLVSGAGVLLMGGIAMTVTRAVGEIGVNRRTSSDVRATVHSFLARMECVGEILCGIILGVVAQAMTIPVAFACPSALSAGTGVMVIQSHTDGR